MNLDDVFMGEGFWEWLQARMRDRYVFADSEFPPSAYASEPSANREYRRTGFGNYERWDQRFREAAEKSKDLAFSGTVRRHVFEKYEVSSGEVVAGGESVQEWESLFSYIGAQPGVDVFQLFAFTSHVEYRIEVMNAPPCITTAEWPQHTPGHPVLPDRLGLPW